MFADKGLIVWQADPPGLIARKLVRRAASAAWAVWLLERLARLLEQRWPAEAALGPLYRWIIGAYIYQGFQDGLKELPC
jgi:hypothetical protein